MKFSGGVAAERAADLRGQRHRIDQVLAAHLVVDAERAPAHGPVGLPLALDAPARDRRLHLLARLGVDVDDGASLGVPLHHRHLQHLARGRREGEERRVGGAALGAERRQDDVHHLVVHLEHPHQRRVELACLVALGGRQEFVLEAEAVQEPAQARVVVRGEARILVAERIGDGRQRLADVRGQHLLVRHVVRHLAQAVHVVGEADEARLATTFGQHLEGMADHARARDLAEGADVRQAGRAVAGLEDHGFVGGALQAVQPLDQPARLLERPGARLLRGGDERGIERQIERLCHGVILA